MAARNAPLASTPVGAFTDGADCAPVIFNPLSGVIGSPYDALQADPADPNGAFIPNTDDLSTGAAVTGIGFSALNAFDDGATNQSYDDFASVLNASGVGTGYVPGFSGKLGGAYGTLIAIGGGYSEATEDGIAVTMPWFITLGGVAFMGNGTARDLLSSTPDEYVGSPAGFAIASSDVANGATFTIFGAECTNRTGKTIAAGDAAAFVLEEADLIAPPTHPDPYPPL